MWITGCHFNTKGDGYVPRRELSWGEPGWTPLLHFCTGEFPNTDDVTGIMGVGQTLSLPFSCTLILRWLSIDLLEFEIQIFG